MEHELSQGDRKFLEDFEGCRIEPSAFHHREHVRLAYALLTVYGVSEARIRLKGALLRFLDHNGVDPAGYHETMTVGWLLAVHYFMGKSRPARSWREFIRRNGILLDKNILFTHYSRELIASTKAREAFVEPDLDPIPVRVPMAALA